MLASGCSRQATQQATVADHSARSATPPSKQAQASVSQPAKKPALAPAKPPANLLRTFSGKAKGLRALAFSPDSSTLLAWGNELQRWDVKTGNLRQAIKLRRMKGKMQTAVFSADNKMVASIYENEQTAESTGQVQLWDAQSGQWRRTLKHIGVAAVAFSPDGKQLFSADDTDDVTHGTNGTGNIKVWELKMGQLKTTFGKKLQYYSLALSTYGKRLIMGENSFVRLWRLNPPKVLWSIEHRKQGFQSQAWSVAFSPDGRLVANSSYEAPIRVWSARSGRLRYELGGGNDFVSHIAFSPDSRTLASNNGSFSTTKIELWDVPKKKLIQTLKGASFPFVFSRDSKTIATSGENGTIQLWQVKK